MPTETENVRLSGKTHFSDMLGRSVYHLVDEGVVSVVDIDTALCWGPGLR